MFHVDFNCRLGKDAELVEGKYGKFISLACAVDTYQNGQKGTAWVNARSSNEKHIKLSQYLTKGRLVHINGTMVDAAAWIDKEQKPHAQLNISIEAIKFVSLGKRDSSESKPTNATEKPGPIQVPATELDDELPF